MFKLFSSFNSLTLLKKSYDFSSSISSSFSGPETLSEHDILIETWAPKAQEEIIQSYRNEEQRQKKTKEIVRDKHASTVHLIHDLEMDCKNEIGFIALQIDFIEKILQSELESHEKLYSQYLLDLNTRHEDLIADYESNLKARVSLKTVEGKQFFDEILNKFKDNTIIEHDKHQTWAKELKKEKQYLSSLLITLKKRYQELLDKRHYTIFNLKTEKTLDWEKDADKINKELKELHKKSHKELDEANKKSIEKFINTHWLNYDKFLCQPDRQGLYIFGQPCKEGYVATLSLLFEHMSFFSCTNKEGDTPLHLLVRYGHIDLLKGYTKQLYKENILLLKNPLTGFNLLHTAVFYEQRDIAKWLIQEMNFDLTKCDNNKNTIFHIVVKKENHQFLIELLSHVKSKNDVINSFDIDNPLVLSYKNHNQRAIEIFQSNNINVSKSDCENILSYIKKESDLDLIVILLKTVNSDNKQFLFSQIKIIYDQIKPSNEEMKKKLTVIQNLMSLTIHGMFNHGMSVENPLVQENKMTI